MSIRGVEADIYQDLFETEVYAETAPGIEALPFFLDMAKPDFDHMTHPTLLDVGCGTGKALEHLVRAGFAVQSCDLVDGRVPEAKALGLPFIETCLWDSLFTETVGHWFDYVYCTDVMEHIPPEFTMLAVANMLRVVNKGVFLQIALVPESHGALVGRDLHLSVFPFTWWRDHLMELGKVRESRDLIMRAVFFVEPS